MNYNFFSHPVFWLFWAGIFSGGVAALIAVRPRERKDPVKFLRRRPAKIYLSLSGAVVCLTSALFASSPDGLSLKFFLAALSGFLLAGLGLRFKKAAGIALLVVSAAALIFGAQALAGWDTAGKTVPAASVLVLALEENAAALSVTVKETKETIIRAALPPGSAVSVKTAVLRIPWPYLIFSAIPLYRIQALGVSGQDYPLPLPEPSDWEKTLLKFPGVHIEILETPLPSLSLFSSYEVFFDPRAGNIHISEKS
jgi:hypothetical protein